MIDRDGREPISWAMGAETNPLSPTNSRPQATCAQARLTNPRARIYTRTRSAHRWPQIQWQHEPERKLYASFGGSAPRLALTPALTGTAPNALSAEDKRLGVDGGWLDQNRGRARGRMPG